MDIGNKHAYQLPVAMTVKSGSYDVLLPSYPELKDLSLEKAYTGKHVRYLSANKKLKPKIGYPAQKLVFVKYQKNQSFIFRKVAKKTALQKLLEETWINPSPAHVTEFFNWFKKAQFYEMSYSNYSDAKRIVSELFKG